MIIVHKRDCDPYYCRDPDCPHCDMWEFAGEFYTTQAAAVEAAEAMFGLLWGPVPSLTKFFECIH